MFDYSWIIAADCEQESTDFNLFPNPASEELIIEFEEAVTDVLQIYDVLGQLIMEQEVTDVDFIALDVSGLRSGFYFLKKGDLVKRFNKT